MIAGVQVRLIKPQEREPFDRLLVEGHYLHSADFVGEQLRYVAEYEGQWVACHGPDGKGGNSGTKDLSASQLSREERLAMIRKGKNAMMPYQGRLSEEQIQAVAEYVESLAGK